ncbi:MAG: putative serine threonine protein kinase [Streblomastix strix]|uniref:Putative serine threonine protein kinase n=1 Tax=Streblomastix strix TaxID=222440 RepID=A0A5J4UBU5_9EUKA|nr:MAG: putative serine threonine protein kinase [Streblomastix strix]
MDYANFGTLNIIAKQPHVPLPSYTLRALMKQILEGMRVIHATNFIHRDIKCDNILLHSPPGSECVYVKIADFGFAKEEDLSNKQTYLKGTLPYWGPELYQFPINLTHKVDQFAIGVIFYRLITRKYPIFEATYEKQKLKMAQLNSIKRPSEIKDDIQWDLLSKLLEFDPIKRITAEQALQHPYFTSPESLSDVSKEQQELAQIAKQTQLKEGNFSFTKFDKDPTFIVAESVIKQFILEDIRLQKLKEQQFDQQKGLSQQEVELKEEFQTVFSLKELEEKQLNNNYKQSKIQLN